MLPIQVIVTADLSYVDDLDCWVTSNVTGWEMDEGTRLNICSKVGGRERERGVRGREMRVEKGEEEGGVKLLM